MYSHPFVSSTHAEVPALLRSRESRADPGSECERILVPFDGSRAAQQALQHAIATSRRSGLQIAVVNVQPPVMAGDVSAFASAGAVEESRRSLGMAALRPAMLALQAHQVAHTASVVLGDVASEIARSAHRFGSTKIVMGTRAMNALRSLFSRSVSRRVVKLTTVPVTLVKAGAETPQAALPAPAMPT